MTRIEHKSSLNAARILGVDEKIASRDIKAIAHKRRRLVIIAVAIATLCAVMTLILVLTGTEQALLSLHRSAVFNAIVGAAAVVYAVWMFIGKIKE